MGKIHTDLPLFLRKPNMLRFFKLAAQNTILAYTAPILGEAILNTTLASTNSIKNTMTTNASTENRPPSPIHLKLPPAY